jgi:hypothetical protein
MKTAEGTPQAHRAAAGIRVVGGGGVFIVPHAKPPPERDIPVSPDDKETES